MNKYFKRIFFLTLFSIISILSFTISVKAEDVTQALGASYKIKENVEENELRSGVIHYKDKGLSMTNGTSTFLPQSVNVLTVPSKIGLKVVSWTPQSPTSWARASVTNTAKNFEALNPGWIVVAAVNGDFYDINSLGALPYLPSGAMVANGDVLKPTSSGTTIGYTNNGTTNSFIADKIFRTTALKLAIYNDQNDIIEDIVFDKINTAPKGNETSLYYSYPVMVDKVRENIFNTTPSENSYLVLNQEQGLPMSAGNFFGKGLISSINEEKELPLGSFAIVTKDPKIQAALSIGTKVRVQKDVIGDYEACDNIIGGGVQLVSEGTAVGNTNRDRHPRTIVGKKADGTLVFVTVDGRQESSDMYGMIYDEMSALMLHYDCVEAYNIDGGGSTTMIIREGSKFRIVNSPSDKSERNNANAILIVVPELKLNVSNVLDTSAKVSFSTSNQEILFENIMVEINGVSKPMVNNEIAFDNLLPKTDYLVNYSYQLTYQGNKTDNIGESFSFKTGKNVPSVDTLYYEEVGDEYIIHYKVLDPDKTIIQSYVKYGTEVEFLSNLEGTLALNKTKVSNKQLNFSFISNLEANPNDRITREFEVVKKEAPIKKTGCNSQSYLIYLSTIMAFSSGLYLIRKKK